MSGWYVVYISSVWCLHLRPLSSYFNTTVWSAPICSWSLCLCLLSKTLFIPPCFSNPRSPVLPVTSPPYVCVCRFECLLFSEQMCVRIKCRKVKDVLHLYDHPVLWILFMDFRNFFCIKFEQKHYFCSECFLRSWLEIMIMIQRQTFCLGLKPSVDAFFNPLCNQMSPLVSFTVPVVGAWKPNRVQGLCSCMSLSSVEFFVYP